MQASWPALPLLLMSALGPRFPFPRLRRIAPSGPWADRQSEEWGQATAGQGPPAWIEPVTVLAVTLLAAVGLVLRRGGNGGSIVAPGLGAGLAIAGTAVLSRSRMAPWLPFAAILGGVTLIGGTDAGNVIWFVLVLTVGCVEVRYGSPAGNGVWLAAMVVIAANAVADPDPGWLAYAAGTTLAAVGCRAGHRQAMLVHQVRAAQFRLAEQVAIEERNRIARELHDVIAHTLTVSLLHITSARLAVEHDPEDAVRALTEAERLGRESLDEVRRAVGLLREEGHGSARRPLPAIGDLEELVERFASAGVAVTTRVEGDIATVSPAVGLSAYRIVQEALTNAAKHAPGAAVMLQVTVGPSAIELMVDSAGPPGRSQGLGVVGMRERAQLLGGQLSAGAGGSGWLVRASLPLRASGSLTSMSQVDPADRTGPVAPRWP